MCSYQHQWAPPPVPTQYKIPYCTVYSVFIEGLENYTTLCVTNFGPNSVFCCILGPQLINGRVCVQVHYHRSLFRVIGHFRFPNNVSWLRRFQTNTEYTLATQCMQACYIFYTESTQYSLFQYCRDNLK